MIKDRSWTEINLDNYRNNVAKLKSLIRKDQKIMQIVKADAYGHGAYRIAKEAEEMGIRLLGVANVDEGVMLRYQGITAPILILSPSLDNEIESIINNDLTPSISNLHFARGLGAIAASRKIVVDVHLIVDTGMGRNGIQYRDFIDVYNEIKMIPALRISGIFSHYSSSEDDNEYTSLQLSRFHDLIARLDSKPEFIHIANSSAVVTTDDEITNLVRIGLLSYGINTSNAIASKLHLKPVMTYKTRISMIKQAEVDDFIGYNRTYKVTEKTRYAILPVGYADGYDFLLSNKGFVEIKNRLYPVIGKVSMDMIAIDIGVTDVIELNEEVTLLGGENPQLRAENLTALFEGSSYELVCQIGRRAKRYYIKQGKIVDSSPLLRRNFISTDYDSKELSKVIETAIEQRLQSKEISDIVYEDILKRLFSDHDNKISYRYNFRHVIEFHQKEKMDDDFYPVTTTLQYRKQLNRDYFIVACAKSEELLERYFQRHDVEYRWLLSDLQYLDEKFFSIKAVKVNGVNLDFTREVKDGCLEFRCTHNSLSKLIGEDVEFSIKTETYYPANSHQLSVYINEMTRGADIQFIHNKIFNQIEITPILSGKTRFPEIIKESNQIIMKTAEDQWIIPNSGVVFSY